MSNCFLPADILLPDASVPLDPWASIAVDQFTSQPDYWQRAEAWWGRQALRCAAVGAGALVGPLNRGVGPVGDLSMGWRVHGIAQIFPDKISA